MALTPEQNERWRKAIPIREYLDGYALQPEGLGESNQRIQVGWGAPGWATMMRNTLIVNAGKKVTPWVPEFALRSEVAMIGLNLLYPEPKAHRALYQQLLSDLLSRALTPLANVSPIFQEIGTLLGAAPQETALLDRQLEVIQERRLELGSPDSPEGKAQLSHLRLSQDCVELVRMADSRNPKEWWRWWSRGWSNLVYGLTWSYQLRINIGGFSGAVQEELERRGRYQPVADALLAALEAKCPPPDWLPRL